MEFFHRCLKLACFFFNFPVSHALGTRLKGRPVKLCDFIDCNLESRASQKYKVVVIRFCGHACRVNIALTVIKKNARILDASVKCKLKL